MSTDPSDPGSDEWSEWLLHDRHGGDPTSERTIRAAVDGFVDRLLDAAHLSAHITLADVGTGDGVVAFRAIDRVGPSLRVVLADISAPLLRHAKALAMQRGIVHQCEFVHCPADDLKGIGNAAVDAVTTRAVLAYVADKSAALREFYRVLKPGGWISIAEPILQDEAFKVIALKRRLDALGPAEQDEALSLLHRWRAAQFPDTIEKLAASPIANYSERDLVHFASECGFVEIHLELHLDIRPIDGISWDAFLKGSPHPWAPTAAVILAEQFNADEQKCLEQMLRPAVEAGQPSSTTLIAYLSARKPAA